MKKILGCGLVLLLAIVVVGMIMSISSTAPSSTPSNSSGVPRATAIPKKGLTLVRYDWKTGEYGNRFIAGTVKNESTKQYSYAQVEFNLYDDSGAQVGSALANISNLEAGSTWNFEAIVLEDKATKAKFKELTGW